MSHWWKDLLIFGLCSYIHFSCLIEISSALWLEFGLCSGIMYIFYNSNHACFKIPNILRCLSFRHVQNSKPKEGQRCSSESLLIFGMTHWLEGLGIWCLNGISLYFYYQRRWQFHGWCGMYFRCFWVVLFWVVPECWTLVIEWPKREACKVPSRWNEESRRSKQNSCVRRHSHRNANRYCQLEQSYSA